MKKIIVIHTGGTISMLEDKTTGEVNITKEHPLSHTLNNIKINAKIDEHIEFDLPSPHITPALMLTLKKKIEQLLPHYDGFVITHGTDTLEETAFFLQLCLDTEKPVILTGAMRSSNEIGSDAQYNLISSLRVAIDENAKNKGVLVVMNDEIHLAEDVTKTSTSNIATFQSPQFGPIGIITKQSVVFQRIGLPSRKYKVDDLHHHVVMLKAYAGMDASIFYAIQTMNPNGIVIEALGQGNLPKETLSGIQALIDKNIPIVLVSRSFKGNVQPTYSYEGGGKKLKEMGVIFAQGLSGQKARIKLLILLEQASNLPTLRNLFEND